MKVLLKKERISDSDYVESDILLTDYIKLEDLTEMEARIKDLEDRLDLVKDLSKIDIADKFVGDRVFNINNPIDISALPDIETFITTPGILYYDKTNKRLRYRSETSWVTLLK